MQGKSKRINWFTFRNGFFRVVVMAMSAHNPIRLLLICFWLEFRWINLLQCLVQFNGNSFSMLKTCPKFENKFYPWNMTASALCSHFCCLNVCLSKIVVLFWVHTSAQFRNLHFRSSHFRFMFVSSFWLFDFFPPTDPNFAFFRFLYFSFPFCVKDAPILVSLF